MFVPADKSLFGSLDKGVEHQRRYERDEITSKLIDAGFQVEEVSYQNRVAKLAWWVNSKLLRRSALPSAQSRVFDFMVPLLKQFDGAHPSSGLSLIAVARKPEHG